jgi:hypothetical protein
VFTKQASAGKQAIAKAGKFAIQHKHADQHLVTAMQTTNVINHMNTAILPNTNAVLLQDTALIQGTVILGNNATFLPRDASSLMGCAILMVIVKHGRHAMSKHMHVHQNPVSV